MTTQETTLIEQARQGDSEAFGELMQLHQDRLYSAMVHVMRCPADAEDVTQTAFIEAFRKLDQFRGDSSFYTWIYRIALNRSVDQRRRCRPTQSLDSVLPQLQQQPCSTEDSPSRPLELQEQTGRVQRALAALSEKDRAILVLREWEQFDYATISQVLGLNLGTVRSRLHRARSHLLEALQRLETAGAKRSMPPAG